MTHEMTLLIACTALSLSAVMLLALPHFRRKPQALPDSDLSRRLDHAIHLFEEAFELGNPRPADALTPIANALEELRNEVAGVARTIEALRGAESSTADPVALEHQILAASWKQFRADRELSAALDDALQDRTWTRLIDELKNAVPNDLEPTFEAVIAPCREHRTLVQKIELIPRVVNGEFPRLATDAAEVHRTRELASLLTPDNSQRLDFRLERWVTDTFLPFADLYLQRYQQAQLEERAEELQGGQDLIRQLLRIATVEPIEVTPGETVFDSSRHVGRSTTNDPRFADGVITAVIRNGFVEGRQVIRQPEVIVNRLR